MSLEFQVVVLLVFHWLGDFVFQSDWMATNKSKKLDALIVHSLVYTYTLLLGLNLCLYGMYSIRVLSLFALYNGMCHFVVDYVTSRINTKLWCAKMVHYFFVSVGFDQLLHYCIFVFWVWYLK